MVNKFNSFLVLSLLVQTIVSAKPFNLCRDSLMDRAAEDIANGNYVSVSHEKAFEAVKDIFIPKPSEASNIRQPFDVFKIQLLGSHEKGLEGTVNRIVTAVSFNPTVNKDYNRLEGVDYSAVFQYVLPEYKNTPFQVELPLVLMEKNHKGRFERVLDYAFTESSFDLLVEQVSTPQWSSHGLVSLKKPQIVRLTVQYEGETQKVTFSRYLPWSFKNIFEGRFKGVWESFSFRVSGLGKPKQIARLAR